MNFIDTQQEYMPIRSSKTINFVRIKRFLLKMFTNDAFEELYKEFNSLGMSYKSLEQFFNQEGYDVLTWILRISKNNKSFQFMFENIPLPILQSMISFNDFINLKQFLNGRAAIEEFDSITRQERELDQERFKFLLTVDREAVQNFMITNKTTSLVTPNIWEDYEIALNSLKQHSSPTVKI
jgi:hypothetical protein